MSLQSRLADFIASVGADYKRANHVVSVTTTTNLVPAATSHQFNVLAQAAALTIDAPTGTPIPGQSLIIRIKDNGTAQTLTWNIIYRVVGVVLPTTTVIGKMLYIGAKWNSTDSKWDVLAISKEV